MATRPYQKHSPVIKRNGESQNECLKKTKHAEFSEKRTFTCAYQGVRNVCFLENLACFVFLKHPLWDSSFGLTTDTLSKTRMSVFKKANAKQGCFIWQHLARVLVLLFISCCKWLFFDFLSTINDSKEIVWCYNWI